MPAPAALLLSAAWVSAPHAWTSDVSVSVDDFGQEDKPADVVFASNLAIACSTDTNNGWQLHKTNLHDNNHGLVSQMHGAKELLHIEKMQK